MRLIVVWQVFDMIYDKKEMNKKELGNSVVAMIYKDGKIIYTKNL